MIFIVPLLIFFLIIWGLNTFYLDAPDEPKSIEQKKEYNITDNSKKANEYFKKYIDK